MRLEDFDYRLPQELIAQSPVEPRDDSRLMVLDRESGKVSHDRFYNLTQWLRPSDVLVLNRTKVLPARLFGIKEDTGARLEVLLLRPWEGRGVTCEGRGVTCEARGVTCETQIVTWEVLLRPAKRLRVGQTLLFSARVEENGQWTDITDITDTTDTTDSADSADSADTTDSALVQQLRGHLVDVLPNGNRVMEFVCERPFDEVLGRIGRVPLPPYITTELEDRDRYQTVYARETGSVAAPTAGLHFTPELLERVGLMGVEIAEVLLHVGLGTFRPVQCENIREHQMHTEYYEISPETEACLLQAKEQNRRIVAVGTTTARALESWGLGGSHLQSTGWTDIFIYPGYEFRVVDALITNFHFPRSTLLMLVSALAGRERVLAAYDEAVAWQYRFYSFGDAMLIV